MDRLCSAWRGDHGDGGFHISTLSGEYGDRGVGLSCTRLAFEFAHTQANLTSIFGDFCDPDRTRRLDMMDRGNRWDFLFMTLYSLFGALFGWASLPSRSSWGRLIISAAVVGAAADAAETSLLLSISDIFRAGEPQGAALGYLWLPVTVKFVSIGATIGGASVFLLSQRLWVWKAVGALAVLCGVVAALAAFELFGTLDYVGATIGLGWLIMLVFAGVRAVRRPIPPRP